MNDLARNSYYEMIMKEGRRDHNSPHVGHRSADEKDRRSRSET